MNVFRIRIGLSGTNDNPETIVERVVARSITEAAALACEAIDKAGHVVTYLDIALMCENAFYNRVPHPPTPTNL